MGDSLCVRVGGRNRPHHPTHSTSSHPHLHTPLFVCCSSPLGRRGPPGSAARRPLPPRPGRMIIIKTGFFIWGGGGLFSFSSCHTHGCIDDILPNRHDVCLQNPPHTTPNEQTTEFAPGHPIAPPRPPHRRRVLQATPGDDGVSVCVCMCFLDSYMDGWVGD